MKHFAIDTENNITVHASRNAARHTGAGIFATDVQSTARPVTATLRPFAHVAGRLLVRRDPDHLTR